MSTGRLVIMIKYGNCSDGGTYRTLWKHMQGTANLEQGSGRASREKSHFSRAVRDDQEELLRQADGECCSRIKAEKSSCKRQGQSLNGTFIEEKLYKPLNYLAWLI